MIDHRKAKKLLEPAVSIQEQINLVNQMQSANDVIKRQIVERLKTELACYLNEYDTYIRKKDR